MWQEEYSPTGPILPTGFGEGKREGKEKNTDFRERVSNFSLDFPAIRPSVFGEARSKVSSQGKGYA